MLDCLNILKIKNTSILIICSLTITLFLLVEKLNLNGL
jgi:hypothetical protein